MARRVREFVAGVKLVGAGYRTWRGSPRLMVVGLIPGLIVAALLAGAFAAIIVWVDDWARAVTSAVVNDPTPNGFLVALVSVAILGGGVLLAVYTFTALTLLVGQPFFEAIVDQVAPGAGLAFTAAEEPWWRSTWRGITEGLRLLLLGLCVGLVTFLIGLIPVVGAVTAFVVAATVGGTLLTLELTAYPLARVGVATLRERRKLLRARRSLALGFGFTAYVVCLVPFGAVVSMPALVSGATMLASRLVANGEAAAFEPHTITSG